MQVNVFVIRGDSENKLLVLPVSPEAAIPLQFQIGWNYYATVDTRDGKFRGVDARAIDAEIAASGLAVVKPMVPDRS